MVGVWTLNDGTFAGREMQRKDFVFVLNWKNIKIHQTIAMFYFL